MDSIFSGVGTFRWSTFICVALVPVASFVQPILPAALSLTLIVQGFVCCQIGLSMIHTDSERGLARCYGSCSRNQRRKLGTRSRRYPLRSDLRIIQER